MQFGAETFISLKHCSNFSNIIVRKKSSVNNFCKTLKYVNRNFTPMTFKKNKIATKFNKNYDFNL